MRRQAGSPLCPRSQHRHAPGRASGPQVGRRRPRARTATGAAHADKAFVLGEPKTKNSRRTFRLTKGTVSVATEAGTIINPSNLRNRSLNSLLKRAEVPQIRFHDLRHTCATLLLSKDVNPKVVSEMIGHSSITLDIYSHLLPDMQEKAVEALEEMLS